MRYLFGIVLCGVLLSARNVQAVSSPVVINEVMWMGSSVSSADEWIELRNTTDHDVDLSGWVLTRQSNGLQVPMITIPNGKYIPANGYFLISNYQMGEKSVLNSAPDLVTTDVSLANSDLSLELHDANQAIIDVAGNGDGDPLAGLNIPSEHRLLSMERNSEVGDGTQAASWHTATASHNLIPLSVEMATPGRENSNGAPVMNFSSTWKTTVGQPLVLDASDTIDPENNSLTYSWDIGGAKFSGPQITYQAATVGTITGTVDVTDGVSITRTTFHIEVAATGAMVDGGASGASTGTADLPKCLAVQFVELLPNPTGADTAEFMVIKNTGSDPASLAGCRVQVNGSRQYQLSGTVSPQSEILLTKQRFRLPNTASFIELVSIEGTVVDRVQYPKTPEGRSWSRQGNDWGWARPTPNGNNAAFDPVESSALGASTTKKEVTRIRVQGRVVAQTGLVGSRYAVVLASDGLWLARTAENTTLNIFSSVVLIGKQITYQGQRAIAVEGKPVISKGTTIPAGQAKLGDLDEQDAYRVVTVTGTVQMVRGSSIDLEDDTGQGTITIKTASHIIRPTLRAGDRLTATGVVMAGVTGLRILPRQKSDLAIVERIQPTTSPVVQVAPVAENAVLWYWVAGGIGLGSIALWKLWQQQKQKGK